MAVWCLGIGALPVRSAGPASEREIERRRDRRPDCRGHRRRQQRSRVSDTVRHRGLGRGTVQVRKLLRLRRRSSQGGRGLELP
ncbi:hypothetical protein NDU88_007029 [Pleurodeles waltl]|uniref:Secreted protein n=1 Tax=Pleurodeles waltl TaxID=8319 RepID=A0AAV7MLS2_PLEWA|nr:hypothetical protein NDU88_007029 [Pleurodeles waltl]